MIEYVYKGFKVVYKVEASEQNSNLYKADGQVLTSSEHKEPILAQKFHTEYPSKLGAQTQIRKLVEDYIDFEWKKFYEMQEKI